MEFVQITPAALRTHWPLILPSLCAVRVKADDDWIAEDVYHAIKSGEACCHMALGEGGYMGVLITTITQAEFSGKRALHVWIAHNVGKPDVFEAGMGLLRQMAKRAGVTRITFGSPRKGWSKRFKLVSALYEVSP